MRFNVLVVDDSAVMRAMVARVLRVSGVPLGEVHEAGNGAEGLRLLDDHWIDLALIDINMPEMTGEQMIEQLRRAPATRDLPIVVVSTETSGARIPRLRALGAEFVHKPFTPEALRASVLRALKLSDDQLLGCSTAPSDGCDF